MKATLITGASNGIGYELARIFAQNQKNLVLVARSEGKLQALSQELVDKYKIEVVVIAKDLSKSGAAQEIYDELSQKAVVIDHLVNNAGFGDYGFFKDTELSVEVDMINLNVLALTEFCKLFGKEMVARKSGRIMNVASTAAFQPGPLQAVYFATKAYVLSFSEAIANEFADHQVSVTALCPGATETGFAQTANMDGKSFFKNKNLPTAKDVAEFGYKAMMKGEVVAIHGFMNNLLAQSNRLTPRSLVTTIVRKMQDA